jgi:nitroreductase/dihydropteridine reductase
MSSSSEQQSFLENLEWRRAVKHFGEGEVDTSKILKAMVNAPSSFGVQPYKIIAVTNKEIRAQLLPVCYNQSQITECHTLFVLCARTNVKERAEEFLQVTGAESMRNMLMGFVGSMPNPVEWAKRQAYIALGFGLAACAEQKIASCPMEGFDPASVGKILNLDDSLVPCVLLAVGTVTEKEGTVYPRFRFSEDNLVTKIT